MKRLEAQEVRFWTGKKATDIGRRKATSKTADKSTGQNTKKTLNEV